MSHQIELQCITIPTLVWSRQIWIGDLKPPISEWTGSLTVICTVVVASRERVLNEKDQEEQEYDDEQDEQEQNEWQSEFERNFVVPGGERERG